MTLSPLPASEDVERAPRHRRCQTCISLTGAISLLLLFVGVFVGIGIGIQDAQNRAMTGRGDAQRSDDLVAVCEATTKTIGGHTCYTFPRTTNGSDMALKTWYELNAFWSPPPSESSLRSGVVISQAFTLNEVKELNGFQCHNVSTTGRRTMQLIVGQAGVVPGRQATRIACNYSKDGRGTKNNCATYD